jgi:hypothetical protein
VTREATIPIRVWLPTFLAAIVWWSLAGRETSRDPQEGTAAGASRRAADETAHREADREADKNADPATEPATDAVTDAAADIAADTAVDAEGLAPRRAESVGAGRVETPSNSGTESPRPEGARDESAGLSSAGHSNDGSRDGGAATPPGPATLDSPVLSEANPEIGSRRSAVDAAAPGGSESTEAQPEDGLAVLTSEAAREAGIEEAAAALQLAGSEWHFSGLALAPWIVVARRDGSPPLEDLARARDRLARTLFTSESWSALLATPLLLIDGGDEATARAMKARLRRWSGGSRVIDRATAEQGWIDAAAELVLNSTFPQAPPWWRRGAIAWLAAGESAVALSAPAASTSLATLFAATAPEGGFDGAPFRALAGSFAAFCLDGGDPHGRAAWLETPTLRLARESADEVAARFGCAQFPELEARWQAARGR